MAKKFPRPFMLRHFKGERSGCLRPLLLGAIFALTAVGYWWHFGNRIQELSDTDLQDPKNLIAKDERVTLRVQRYLLKQDAGVRVVLRLQPDSLRVPSHDTEVVFMGVGLAGREAVVLFPPLMQRALGEGTRLQLEDDLRACVRTDTPPATCFAQSMDTLHRVVTQPPTH